MGAIDDIYSMLAQDVHPEPPLNGEIWLTRNGDTTFRRLPLNEEPQAIAARSATAVDFLFTKKIAQYYIETLTPDEHCSMHEVLESERSDVETGDLIMMYTKGIQSQ